MRRIKKAIRIPENELVFRMSRSSGPGGQNVNKVSSRVTVLFDVVNSGSLTDTQKRRILEKLAGRANKDSVIRVVSQRHRSQRANRAAAVARLEELLTISLRTRPVRKKTIPSRAAKQRRLEEKKRRSLLKRQRMEKPDADL